MAYAVKFSIDGYKQECLVVAESENDAVKHLKQNYLGIEDDSIKVESIEERIIIETDLSF